MILRLEQPEGKQMRKEKGQQGVISLSGQDITWRTLVVVITVIHSDSEFTL